MSILLGRARIAELKFQLKLTVNKRNRMVDSFGGDCGMQLIRTIRPDIAMLELKANSILDELAKVDPKCPTFRYSV